MTYHKILVDNTSCLRRFHVAFDDEGAQLPEVNLKCLHCGEIVFSKQNHPAAKIVRDENLVRYDLLSPHRTQKCQFVDTYSPKPEPIQ